MRRQFAGDGRFSDGNPGVLLPQIAITADFPCVCFCYAFLVSVIGRYRALFQADNAFSVA
jgi:hypothetical protein